MNESTLGRAILASIPLFLLQSKKLHFYYGVGVFVIFTYYILNKSSLEVHDLRAFLFYSQITLALYLYYKIKHCADVIMLTKKTNIIIYIIIILTMSNLLIPYISDQSFSINKDILDEERYRGYFPTLLAIALVASTKNKFSKIAIGVLFSLIIFSVTGTRGQAAMFTAIAFGAAFFSAKNFYIYIVFLNIAVYPIFLLILSVLDSIVGSFLVKSNGFIYLIDNLALFGHGIQPPSTDELARVDIYGIHFSAADYGFYGLAYELGFPALVLSAFLGLRLYDIVNKFIDQRLAYVFSYISVSFCFTYSIARNYEELIMVIVFFGLLITSKAKKSIPDPCKT